MRCRRGAHGYFLALRDAGLAHRVALSALGSYIYYPRLHTPYGPLLLAVGWGSLLCLRPARAGWASYARSMAGKAASRVRSTHRGAYCK